MSNYSLIEEVWGEPFPGNNREKKPKKPKKVKKKAPAVVPSEPTSNYNFHDYTLNPLNSNLSNEGNKYHSCEAFTNFDSNKLMEQNKEYDNYFKNNNDPRIQVSYENDVVEEEDEEVAEEELSRNNKKNSKPSDHTLLENKVNELSDKINKLMEALDNNNNNNNNGKDLDKKTTSEDINKNIYDLLLFGIFGVFFLLLLESLSKLLLRNRTL